jgi:hypothetical protein
VGVEDELHAAVGDANSERSRPEAKQLSKAPLDVFGRFSGHVAELDKALCRLEDG